MSEDLRTLPAELADIEALLGTIAGVDEMDGALVGIEGVTSSEATQNLETAQALLERRVKEVEAYVARFCPTTDTVQWFSFPTFFERLCYRRVEGDPRELKDVGAPLSRLYADLAFAHDVSGDLASEKAALMQAIRWNPMDCDLRLELARVSLSLGDTNQWLALAHSIFDRASEAENLVDAYLIFAQYFLGQENAPAVAACLAAARRFGVASPTLAAVLSAAEGTDADPDTLTDDEIAEILASEGLPEGANAEVALCLLMCATDAATLGQEALSQTLLARAVSLVGENASQALLTLLRETDEELARELASQDRSDKTHPHNEDADGDDKSSKEIVGANG